MTNMFGDNRVDQRFWKFVVAVGDAQSGCWLWTGALRRGYGTYWLNRRNACAHVVAYTALVGPIPEGLQIDHLCHDPATCQRGEECPHRRCVNPAHLKVSTGRDNTLRGGNPAAKFARASHCVNGHEFDEANTYYRPTGGRACRRCAHDRILRTRPLRTRADINTHCVHGHEWTPETLYIYPNGSRSCRRCIREQARARRTVRKETKQS